MRRGLLFPLGVFFEDIKHFCLSFMFILPIFYLNYIYYSSLLIYCLKEQTLIEFSARKNSGKSTDKGVHFRCFPVHAPRS